jgi:hypothetical protein
MDDSSPISPFDAQPGPDAFAAPDPREELARVARAQSLRRLKRLLILGCAFFTLTIWLFVLMESPGKFSPFAPGPSRIVRQHLEALNRGAFREAYLLFSPHYRDEISFELYHQLVITHAAMFRTRIVSVRHQESSGNRIVLDTRLLASDGERYVARFTLVQVGNRWWIDDLRWGTDTDRRIIISV